MTSAPSLSAPTALLRDGALVATGVLSKDFIRNSPRGPYTTARTVAAHSVYELEMQVDRLRESTTLMLADTSHPVAQYVSDRPRFRADLVSDLRAALTQYREVEKQASAGPSAECKITVLLTWEDQPLGDAKKTSRPLAMNIHVCALPVRAPEEQIIVEVRPAARSNALCKDSEWVREREALESLKGPNTEEIVMVDADGTVKEGTQTNFFVVDKEGRVWTAGEGVLMGTIRAHVLKCAADLGIPVVEQSPALARIADWREAFITSTSRLVMPIDTLVVRAEGAPGAGAVVDGEVAMADGTVARRLSAEVARTILDESGRVL